MAQVLKADVRERILAAGRQSFFDNGFDGTVMSSVAKSAGVATANIYRYFPDKSALFDAAIPVGLVVEHDRLLDDRIEALIEPMGTEGKAAALLDFWIANRLEIATLLDHDGQTSRSAYRDLFVARLVGHVERTIDRPLDGTQRALLTIVFDNTRLAIATILRSTGDAAELRRSIAGFWSYQVPGLDGLIRWIDPGPRAESADDVADQAPTGVVPNIRTRRPTSN